MAEVKKQSTVTLELTEEEARVVAALCGMTSGCDSSAQAAWSVFNALESSGMRYYEVYRSVRLNNLANSIQFSK
jgi:hypothetical protein